LRASLRLDNSANYESNLNLFAPNASGEWDEANESKIILVAPIISEIVSKPERTWIGRKFKNFAHLECDPQDIV
jgi:hypothetical protein